MLNEEGTRLVETVFAGILILWGAYLIAPVAWRFNDLYWAANRQTTPETIWAGAMLLVGSLLFIGTVRDRRNLRRGALLCAAMLFVALWSVYYLAGRASVGLIILPFYALVSALLFLHPRFRPSPREEVEDGKFGRDHRVGSGDVGSDGDRYQNRRHLAGTP